MNTVLELFKLDLGITHTLRDTYFYTLIESARKQIEDKGIVLDESLLDDQMLIVNYAAWMYRKRQEDVPLSRHLQQQIRNRIIKGRARNAEH